VGEGVAKQRVRGRRSKLKCKDLENAVFTTYFRQVHRPFLLTPV
jgi:hypothetical protein